MKKKQRRKVMKMIQEEGKVPSDMGDVTRAHKSIPPYPYKLARFQRRFVAENQD